MPWKIQKRAKEFTTRFMPFSEKTPFRVQIIYRWYQPYTKEESVTARNSGNFLRAQESSLKVYIGKPPLRLLQKLQIALIKGRIYSLDLTEFDTVGTLSQTTYNKGQSTTRTGNAKLFKLAHPKFDERLSTLDILLLEGAHRAGN